MRALGGVFSLLGLLALVTALAGCADDGATRALPEWTLSGENGLAQPLSLPMHVGGLLPRAHAHFFLRHAVTLDPAMRGRDLVLVFPRLLAHVTLRVDGVEARALEGGDTRGYRACGPHAWQIPASETSKDTLALELDVDHTWTQSGWLDTVPRLTSSPDGGAAFAWQRTFNDVTAWLALGFALFAGYLYLVIFLTDVRRRSFLWFALTGMGGCLYPLFVTGIGQRLLGPFETSAAAIGTSTAVVTQLYFTNAEFHLPRPGRLWGVAWACVAIASLASTGYFTGTQLGGTTAVALTIPAVFAQVRLFLRLARQKPRPVNLVLVLGGWVALSALVLPDAIAWGGFGEVLGGTRTGCLGVFVIAILQTTALSREHARSLLRAEELAGEREDRIRLLEARNRDIEVLNDELRRQVAARSRVLADALSREAGATEEKVLHFGDVVQGRYAVIRVLGEGAAGVVYLVERTVDRAWFAMKVVRGTNDRRALARLAREAQLAAEVKHENVITVVDVDVAGSTTGFLYVVMKYVAGDSLREHREEYGDVPWALDVLHQIAAGLASVHARGIVHRDLKPANVLLVPRDGEAPLVKIADFGIAGMATGITGDPRATASTTRALVSAGATEIAQMRADERLTQTGMLLGTPLYMAPETIEGAKNAAPPVDLFSFGVIAYELLTKAMPFRESPALAQLQGASVAPPIPIAVTRPGLPRVVASLIDRCLSFEPAERPTAIEARDVLARARTRAPDEVGEADEPAALDR